MCDYGNYLYRILMQRRDDENIEHYYDNLEEALQWGLIHGKREQHGTHGFKYQTPNNITHRILNDRHIEHIEQQIQKAKEMTLKEEKEKKAIQPGWDMEAIKKELLSRFVKESHGEELSSLLSYGRVYRRRIDWCGNYRELQDKIRPLFEDESIPHLHSQQWIHFAMNNFTKNGKDLSEKSLRNEMTR